VVAAPLPQVAEAGPEVAEIEINPLLVTPAGAVALDARVIRLEEGADHAR
jgi:acetate---CoA ligase (ADP-forming)